MGAGEVGKAPDVSLANPDSTVKAPFLPQWPAPLLPREISESLPASPAAGWDNLSVMKASEA